MRRVIAAVALVLCAAFAAGCGGAAQSLDHALPDPVPPSGSIPQMCTKNGPVVFAVAGRQNSPAPVLTGTMRSAASTAIHEGSAIGLVDLDGRPRLIMAGAFTDPGANSIATQAAQRNYLGSLTSAVERTRAAFPHADVLDALNVAGHAIRAACLHGGTVYLEDSGLQETGLVNFCETGMLGAAPADVVSFLAHKHDLPDLAGITVVLIGLGDTAPPQHPLTISEQNDVVAIWSAIAKAGGASSVRVDPAPLSGAGPAHVPPVSLVPVPAVQSWVPSIFRPSFAFPDSGPVGFEPNTAVFRDRAAAFATLRRLADYLTTHPAARIELTGTTARWGPFAWDLTLSRRRADAVKAAIVQLGAAPGQIATRGLGWRFPGYINDQGPGGELLPGPAEHNRSVIAMSILTRD